MKISTTTTRKSFIASLIKTIKHYTFKYLYVWRDFFLFRSNMVVAMVTLDWWCTEITKDGQSLKNTAKNDLSLYISLLGFACEPVRWTLVCLIAVQQRACSLPISFSHLNRTAINVSSKLTTLTSISQTFAQVRYTRNLWTLTYALGF